MRRLIDRSRGDSGTAALQFALIVPLLLLLVFGIMEFSLMLRDDIAMNNLVRDASRAASVNPRVGNVAGHGGDGPGGAEASFAYYAAKMIEESGSALPKDSIQDMYVYLANAEGYPTTTRGWKFNPNRTMTTCPPEYCVHYIWIDATDRFSVAEGAWDPASINACPRAPDHPQSPDLMSVGIYLRVDHVGLFKGLFNLTLTLTDRNVVMFEPIPEEEGDLPGDCGPPYTDLIPS